MDDRFAVINKTREIIEANCLPIDIAAEHRHAGPVPVTFRARRLA